MVKERSGTNIPFGNEVFYDDYAIGYLTGTLRAGVWAVRQHINRPEYKQLIGDNVSVEMDAPLEEQRYPYIHVMYRDGGFQPLSIKGKGWYLEDDGSKVDIVGYKFKGTYLINIYATTILERETLSDICIGACGIDPRFKYLLIDNPYINIAPNMATMSSPTSNESWGTPWDKDVMTAFRQLSFDVSGEFYYKITTEPMYLSRIVIQGMIEDKKLDPIIIDGGDSE